MKFLRRFHCPAAWPSFGLILIFAIVYFIFCAGIVIIGNASLARLRAILSAPETACVLAILIGTAAVIHALYRLARFHPGCNFAYASWLALSPWTSAKPLPLGPITPVWQDAVVLSVLGALGYATSRINPVIPLADFGWTYLIGLTLLLALTSTWPYFFAVCFLWPSLFLTNGEQTPLVVIFAAIVIVLWLGLRRSLQTFPWRQENRTSPGLAKPFTAESFFRMEIKIVDGMNAFATQSTVGWPYSQLSPKAKFKSVSITNSFRVSLLIGWWAYCIMKAGSMEPMAPLILVFGIGGGLVRLGIYLGSLGPPFSFRSRLLTGRLIVPGFDQIFVTPLAAIAVAIVGGMIIGHQDFFCPEIHAIFIGLILFILLRGGPTMRNWVLTGQHRFQPRFAGGKNRQYFRPV